MRIIPNAISSKVSLALLHTQKHSPTILFAGGVVGVVATAVLASRATLKLEEVLEESVDKLKGIDKIKYVDVVDPEQERVKDKAVVLAHTSIKVAQLYGPTIVVGVASIGALAGSHHILTKRNAAITAAYAALDKTYRRYRDRVIADQGEDKDRQYLTGGEVIKVSETSEDGKKKVVAKKVATTGVSEYAVLFNSHNVNWHERAEYNLMSIRTQQHMLNDMLNAKGYVLLNDAYEALGFDRTKAGCVVGWLKNGNGDGYIDFGIFDDANSLQVRDYVFGHEDEIVIDFNVDGIIYDRLGR